MTNTRRVGFVQTVLLAMCLAACGGAEPTTEPPSTRVDADGDGIYDQYDACPSDPETQNGYLDSDGCPDSPPPPPPADADHDGVPDASDLCPSAPETQNSYQDSDGCPDLSGMFSGRWSGQAVLQFQNEVPWFNSTVVLTGAVSGNAVAISPVCPLGDGVINTNTARDQFSPEWSGAMACAPIAFTNGCQYVVLTYQAAAFSLSVDGRTLGAAGGGVASGCGISKPFQMTFSGVRQ